MPLHSSQEATARPAPCPVPAEMPWFVGSAPRPGQIPTETAQLLPAPFQGGVSTDSRVPARCPEERQGWATTAYSDPGTCPGGLRTAGLGPWFGGPSGGGLPTTTQPGKEAELTYRGPTSVDRGEPSIYLGNTIHASPTGGGLDPPRLYAGFWLGEIEARRGFCVREHGRPCAEHPVSLGTKVC